MRWRPIDCHDRAAIVSHDLTGIWFPPSDCHHLVEVSPDAATCLPTMRHNRDLIKAVRCSLTRSTALFSARAPDDDRVDPESTASTYFIWYALIQRSQRYHLSCKDKFPREHSPTRKKRERMSSIKVGQLNAFALPPQTTNQGPLTRGPSTCQPLTFHVAPLPCVRVDSRGPCHASAPPCATRVPRGLARLCHVALRAASHPRGSRAPRQLCAPHQPRGPAEINPLFCD